MTKEEKEQVEKAKRAKIAILDTESNGCLFVAWLLVFGKSKEYAEKY